MYLRATLSVSTIPLNKTPLESLASSIEGKLSSHVCVAGVALLTIKPNQSADQREASPRGENILASIVGPDRLMVTSERGFLLRHVDERRQGCKCLVL